MTLDDLVAECWFDLPPIRKRIAGRDAVRQVVVDAIQEWSPGVLGACSTDDQRAAYAADLTERLKRRYAGQQEYGFAIMTIILVAVISAVVQWLVKWWLDRNFNRECMARLQQELAG